MSKLKLKTKSDPCMKTERQKDVTSSNIGQAKLSKFFTNRDDEEDATEKKIKREIVIKAETSSKNFACNTSDGLDESISDFKPERPKKIVALPANDRKDKKPVKSKKVVRKNSTTAPKKKCTKKQQNLLKYTKDFEEVCAIGGVDINPEDLQLAIALSSSLSDYQDGGNSNKEDASDPSTSQEFKSEEDMVKRIRKTLDQYGFKVPIGPISLLPKATAKRKRFNKATANSVLMTRSLEEKKQITSTKISQILFECQIKDPDEDFGSPAKITDLHSNVLREIWCKTSPIFTKAMLDYKDMEEFDVFYVKNLITPSDTKVGSLLKDWKTIPGRDPSPERKSAETLDFRENILFAEHLDLLLSSTFSYISEKISLLDAKSPKKSHLNSSLKEDFLNDTPPKAPSNVSPKNTCLNHSQIKTQSTHIQNSMFVKDDVIEICDGSRSCSPDIFDDDNYYEDVCDTVLSTKSESSKQIHIEIINSSGEESPKVCLTQFQKSEIALSQSDNSENVLSQSCNNDNVTPPVISGTSDTNKCVDFVEKDKQVIEASIDLTQIMYAPDDSIRSNQYSEFKHDKSNASLSINNFKEGEVVCLIDETVDLDLTNSGNETDHVGSQNQSDIKQCDTTNDFVDISDVQIDNQKSLTVSSLIDRNETFDKSLVVKKHKRISFNSIDDSVRFSEILKDFKKTQPNVSIDESAEDPFVEDSIDLTQNDYNPANVSRNRNCSQIYESQNGILHFESYHEDSVELLDISIGGSSPKELQKSFTEKKVCNISTSSGSSKNYSKNESHFDVLHFESDHEDIEILDISKSPHKEIEKMVERNNVNNISISPIAHKTEYHNETGNFDSLPGDINASLIAASSSKIIVRRNINDISFSSPETYKNESKNGIVHFESYYEPLDISASSEEIEKGVRRNVNEISFSSPERSRNVSKEKDTTNIFEEVTVLDGEKSFSFSLDDHENVTVEKENIDLTQTSNDSANSHSRDIAINQSECNKEKSIKESNLILKSPNFKCDDSVLFKNDKSSDKIAKDSTGEISAGNDIFILSDEEFNYSISTPYRPKSLHHSRSKIKNKTNCNDVSSSDDDSSISDKVNQSSPHLNKSTTNRLSSKSTSLYSIKSTKCRLSAKSSSFHLNEPSDVSKCKNDEDCNELGVPYRFSNQFNLYGSSIFDQIPSCNSSLANATYCGRISDTSKRKTINPTKETSLTKDGDCFQSESLPNVYLNKDKQTNNRLTIESSEIDELLRRNKELVNDSPLVKSPSRTDTPDNNKYVIKTDNITPAQNYSAMDTPKIHRELSKFGLKPLKRKRAVQLLEHIYSQTHPIINTSTNEIDLKSKRRKIQYNSTICANTPKATSSSTVCKSKNNIVDENQPKDVEDVGFDNLETGLVSPNNCERDFSNSKSDTDIYKPDCSQIDVRQIHCEPEDWVFQSKEKAKVQGCRVPLHIAFHNYLSVRSKLRDAILRYDPVNIDDIHKGLVADGYRYNAKDLFHFMDKKCITIKTTDKTGGARHHKKTK